MSVYESRLFLPAQQIDGGHVTYSWLGYRDKSNVHTDLEEMHQLYTGQCRTDADSAVHK